MSYLARRAFASTTAAAGAAAGRNSSLSGIARQQRAAFSASARRDIAKITLVGNLGATPEVKPTASGREVIEYTVASNEGPSENRRTSWFRVSAFETEARRDFLTSLPKGSTVYVEGDCSMGTWTDGEGKNRSAINIVQRHLQVLRKPQAPPSE